jgi:hypothetical protein
MANAATQLNTPIDPALAQQFTDSLGGETRRSVIELLLRYWLSLTPAQQAKLRKAVAK